MVKAGRRSLAIGIAIGDRIGSVMVSIPRPDPELLNHVPFMTDPNGAQIRGFSDCLWVQFCVPRQTELRPGRPKQQSPGQSEETNEALGSGPQEASVLNGRNSVTIPKLGILSGFQPADRFVVQAPRPPTHAALRSARVSDLSSVVPALQAGSRCPLLISKSSLTERHS